MNFISFCVDRIEAIDVGIDEFGLCDSPIYSPKVGGSRGLLCAQAFSEITYIHIHECDHFSVSRKLIMSLCV